MSRLHRSILIFVVLVFFPSLAHGQIHDEAPIELSGFSVSETYDIKDDRPLDLDAVPIEQLLYRLTNTSPRTRSHYSQYTQSLSWDDVIARTDEHRMKMFDRSARLKKIEAHAIATAIPDAEITRFFVCHCELEPNPSGDPPQPFIVITRTIPHLLPLDEPIDEPVRVVGFLYLRAIDSNGVKLPVLVSDRLAWYPTDPRPGGPTPSHVALAANGVDIGQFEWVKENNGKRLGKQDSESFFQMISAVAKMPPLKSDFQRLTFTDLIIKKGDQFGNAVRLQGSVRTCTLIKIVDKDIQDRLGITQYYQMMVFPNLRRTTITFDHRDGTKTEYSRFPVTVICLELPDGMSIDDMKSSRVEVDGFFFRYWAFRSDRSDKETGTGQPSLLLIARQPALLASNSDYLNSLLGWIGIALLFGIGVLIVGARFMGRRKKRGPPLIEQLPEKITIAGINDQF